MRILLKEKISECNFNCCKKVREAEIEKYRETNRGRERDEEKETDRKRYT